MRLQKFLADAGVDSRRKCEQLIEAGRVRVNGAVAQIGCTVEPEKDIIELDGQAVTIEAPRVVILLNKPRGVMCTASDPQGRPTIMDYVKDLPMRLYSVGRLDFDSEGLLVMTNDGQLAYRMSHPSFMLDKTYSTVCDGVLTAQQRRTLEQGVLLEDGMTSPAKVGPIRGLTSGNTAFNITIHEGRNRQVRRMLEAVGHKVLSLCRVRFGPLSLDALPRGEFRELTPAEVEKLIASVSPKDGVS